MGQSTQLLPVRSFPLIERQQRLKKKNDFVRVMLARLTNNDFYFRHVNRRYRAALSKLEVPALSPAGERVVRDLRENGIAIAHFSDFFSDAFLGRLKAEFDRLLREFEAPKKEAKGKAVFLDTIYKAHTFTPNDVISAYLGSPEYASIAARYMDMVPRFVGNSFWHTKPAPDEERIYSQLWHRDYNDRRVVKAFLYLNDVGPENGYFEYVARSHALGTYGGRFDVIGEDGLRAYPDQAAVAAALAPLPVIALEDPRPPKTPFVLRCMGPAGTLVFADTFGLHRGGYVIEGYRDVIMTTYSTNHNVHKPHFAVASGFERTLTPFMRMVLGLD